MLDYSGFATKVKGLGPGERVVLWVRGCRIGCPGCMTSDLWANGEARAIEPLAEELARHLQESDGLTISGGEPFDQPEGLSKLLRVLRSKLEINVVCYSGYVLERLQRSEATRDLLGEIDVLIDGPYRQEEGNTKVWRGSDNQRAIALSERATLMSGFDGEYSDQRSLQVQPLKDGGVRIIGIPRRKEMAQLKSLFEARGLEVKEAG